MGEKGEYSDAAQALEAIASFYTISMTCIIFTITAVIFLFWVLWDVLKCPREKEVPDLVEEAITQLKVRLAGNGKGE